MSSNKLDKNKELETLQKMKGVLLEMFEKGASLDRNGKPKHELASSLGALATGYANLIKAEISLQNNLK